MNLPCHCESLAACTHPRIKELATTSARHAKAWGVTDGAISPEMGVDRMLTMIASGEKPVGGWPDDWATWPVTIRAHRILHQRYRDSIPAYPEGRFNGRGIVICAGGVKYFTCVWVLLNLLRGSGCQLPVEVWYLGSSEMDDKMRGLLERFGPIELVNASMVSNCQPESERPRRLAGWESKIFAIRNSRFREVLFLDADNMPLADPEYLFDCDEYKLAGTVFWPDLKPFGWCITEEGFRAAGLDIPGRTEKPTHHAPTDYRPVESGQVLIDKSRAWRSVCLCSHLNDHSDFWYRWEVERRGINIVYGDKDLFFLAWEIMHQSYAMPKDCGWIGDRRSGAFMQHDFGGRVLFQHKVQPVSKFRLDRDNFLCEGMESKDLIRLALHDLKRLWDGKIWGSDNRDRDREYARTVAKHWVLFSGDEPQVPITLDDDGTVAGSPLADFWTVRHHGETPCIVLSSLHRQTGMMYLDNYGNWCDREREIYLMPAPPPNIVLPPGKTEACMCYEIVTKNEYELPERFAPGSMVLDIGANAGCFTYECVNRGASNVVAVEPNPVMLDYFRRNTNAMTNVYTLPYAAWSTETRMVLDFPDGAQHTGGGSIVDPPSEKRVEGLNPVEVETLGIDTIIDFAVRRSQRGRIDLMKLDCEGSEWVILKACTMLDRVDRICGEYHRADADGTRSIKWLAHRLNEFGFAVRIVRRTDELGMFFAERVPTAATENPPTVTVQDAPQMPKTDKGKSEKEKADKRRKRERAGVCVNLGVVVDKLDKKPNCGTCGVNVYKCAVPEIGECIRVNTTGKTIGLACCMDCEQYQAKKLN